MESFNEELNRRTREIMSSGKSRGRPTYEAASLIAEEQDEQRRMVLEARANGYEGPLDPNLFPPEVFDGLGNRKTYADGRPMQTQAEERAAYEWTDSRF